MLIERSSFAEAIRHQTMKQKISIVTMVLLVVLSVPVFVPGSTIRECQHFNLRADLYYRTELYFGRSIPGGGMVSDDEWAKFLAEVVTPRFPDGFTIVRATGQFREKNGTIDKEPTEILLFLYAAKTRTSSRRKIEEIRRAYKRQFRQESVLRMDLPAGVNVLF